MANPKLAWRMLGVRGALPFARGWSSSACATRRTLPGGDTERTCETSGSVMSENGTLYVMYTVYVIYIQLHNITYIILYYMHCMQLCHSD